MPLLLQHIDSVIQIVLGAVCIWLGFGGVRLGTRARMIFRVCGPALVVIGALLLVVRAAETHGEIVKNGLQLLQSAQCRILGAVLNGVNMGRDSYYYYQYYYYYYGEDGEKKKKIRRKKRERSGYYGEENRAEENKTLTV